MTQSVKMSGVFNVLLLSIAILSIRKTCFRVLRNEVFRGFGVVLGVYFGSEKLEKGPFSDQKWVKTGAALTKFLGVSMLTCCSCWVISVLIRCQS